MNLRSLATIPQSIALMSSIAKEKRPLHFKSKNTEVYDKTVSIIELRDSPNRAGDNDARPDEIPY